MTICFTLRFFFLKKKKNQSTSHHTFPTTNVFKKQAGDKALGYRADRLGLDEAMKSRTTSLQGTGLGGGQGESPAGSQSYMTPLRSRNLVSRSQAPEHMFILPSRPFQPLKLIHPWGIARQWKFNRVNSWEQKENLTPEWNPFYIIKPAPLTGEGLQKQPAWNCL